MLPDLAEHLDFKDPLDVPELVSQELLVKLAVPVPLAPPVKMVSTELLVVPDLLDSLVALVPPVKMEVPVSQAPLDPLVLLVPPVVKDQLDPKDQRV